MKNYSKPLTTFLRESIWISSSKLKAGNFNGFFDKALEGRTWYSRRPDTALKPQLHQGNRKIKQKQKALE